MRALPDLRASAIAIVTILAMLIVPACGSVCAAMNHCSQSAASAESDACHHTSVSTQSDSETFSSPASCNQQAPALAILAAPDSFVQLKSEFAANAPFSIETPDHAFTASSWIQEFPSPKESLQQSSPLVSLTVLRI